MDGNPTARVPIEDGEIIDDEEFDDSNVPSTSSAGGSMTRRRQTQRFAPYGISYFFERLSLQRPSCRSIGMRGAVTRPNSGAIFTYLKIGILQNFVSYPAATLSGSNFGSY